MEGDGRKTKTVCVTGAGGFVASWLVQRLLSSGDYTVHGTVRDPSDPKNGHLKALVGAEERLRLFKADVLDYASVASAVAGCDGVFHVASPVPAAKSQNPEVDVLAPAVKGTQNVLNACHEAKVRRVVVVSSAAAVIMNPPPPRTPSWTKTRGQTRTTAETRRFGTASPRRSPSARLWRTRRRHAWTSSRSARPWFSALCCNPWRTPAAWSSSTCSKATVKPSSMTRRGTWWTSVTSPTLSSWCTRTRRRPGGTSAARTGRGCLKWWKSPGASVQI